MKNNWESSWRCGEHGRTGPNSSHGVRIMVIRSTESSILVGLPQTDHVHQKCVDYGPVRIYVFQSAAISRSADCV